jgi:large subunit ribosomal protein L17
MRHYKKGRKLGTDASHTKAIKKNLVVNLFTNDRIKTTLERAKEICGDVDRVITWAKRGDVHSRRLAIAKLGNKELVKEIFSKVEQGLFKDRPGGYTRIMRLGLRRGDSATIVIMELVQEPVAKKAKDADEKPATKKAASKKAAKAVEEEIVDVEPVEAEEVAPEAAEEVATEAEAEEAPAEEAETVEKDEAPAEPESPAEAEEAPAEPESPAEEAAPEAEEAPAEEAPEAVETSDE